MRLKKRENGVEMRSKTIVYLPFILLITPVIFAWCFFISIISSILGSFVKSSLLGLSRTRLILACGKFFLIVCMVGVERITSPIPLCLIINISFAVMEEASFFR